VERGQAAGRSTDTPVGGGSEPGRGGDGPGGDSEVSTTRQRILDIALDLFIEQGFDKTSLRQIAEQLGFSKAALYYHFASKDDILMALHLRFHDIGKESLAALGEKPSSPAAWVPMFDNFISLMMENRRMFVLHERNQAAFENLHRKEHDAEHADLGDRIRAVLRDESIAVEQRLRMACAMGAVMGGLVLAGDTFAEVPSDELSAMLRGAIGDLLGAGPPSRTPRRAKGRPRATGSSASASRRNGSA
jgi:AcrR family transcriptional regulator